MTFISDKRTSGLLRFNNFLIRNSRFALMVGLWVVIPEQYEDAVALLDDENHIIQDPLTEEKMVELDQLAQQEIYEKFGRHFNVYSLCFMLIIVFGIMLIVVNKLLVNV